MKKYGYGCLPAKYDIRDYKLCAAPMGIVYPEEFKLENLPRVKNQGQVNSCCAHATSSILEYHDKNQHQLSTNFIYGIQKKLFNQTQMGMYLKDACAIVVQYGDMLESDCKGNNEIPNCYGVAENALNDMTKKDRAYQFRINSYYACSTPEDIKYALMNHGPVLGAVMWRNKYSIDGNGVIHFDTNSAGGGHAIMVYGWNKQGWLIQNSWGESFGNGGRFVLPYEYLLLESRALIDYVPDRVGESEVFIRPCKCKLLTPIYKLINFVVNLFNMTAKKSPPSKQSVGWG